MSWLGVKLEGKWSRGRELSPFGFCGGRTVIGSPSPTYLKVAPWPSVAEGPLAKFEGGRCKCSHRK